MKALCLFLLVFFCLSCQKYDKVITNIEVSTFLEGTSPTCIEIDPLNNIYVGTHGSGVYRYDGSLWRHFSTQNSSLFSDNIAKIKSGSNNKINIIYSDVLHGRSIVNFANIILENIPAQELRAPISAFIDGKLYDPYITKFGYIYDIEENDWLTLVATYDQGLNVYDILKGGWTNYNTSNSDLPNNSISKIVAVNNLEYILSTTPSLLCYIKFPYKYKGNTVYYGFDVVTYTYPCSYLSEEIMLPDDFVENITKDGASNLCEDLISVDDKGGVWYKTEKGLIRSCYGKSTFFKTDKIDAYVGAEIIYTDNILWIQNSDKVQMVMYSED